MKRAFHDQRFGTFACPVCGFDKPHHHDINGVNAIRLAQHRLGFAVTGASTDYRRELRALWERTNAYIPSLISAGLLQHIGLSPMSTDADQWNRFDDSRGVYTHNAINLLWDMWCRGFEVGFFPLPTNHEPSRDESP